MSVVEWEVLRCIVGERGKGCDDLCELFGTGRKGKKFLVGGLQGYKGGAFEV